MVFLSYNHVWFTDEELSTWQIEKQDCVLQMKTQTRDRVISKPASFYVFDPENGLHGFPKGYIQWYFHQKGDFAKVHNITTVSSEGGKMSILSKDFTGSLRSKLRQEQALLACLHNMRSSPIHGGVLCLPCGWGKTVVCIAICVILNRKTCILVHTNCLQEQWYCRIKQFCPTAKVYKWNTTDKKNDLGGDCDFVICMMQGMSRRRDLDTSSIGVLCVDEAHHVPCTTLRNCLSMTNCQYTLGLTATPYRADGLEKYINWALGTTAFSIDPEYPNIAYTQKLIRPRLLQVSNIPFIDKITGSEERNVIIKETIITLLTKKRNALVVTSRRSHALALYALIESTHPSQALLRIGGDSRGDPSKVGTNTGMCIIATMQLISEGFDMARLDTLLLATPRFADPKCCVWLTQCIGRIDRGANGTTEKIVVDLVDNNYYCTKMAKSRKVFCQKLKMKCC